MSSRLAELSSSEGFIFKKLIFSLYNDTRSVTIGVTPNGLIIRTLIKISSRGPVEIFSAFFPKESFGDTFKLYIERGFFGKFSTDELKSLLKAYRKEDAIKITFVLDGTLKMLVSRMGTFDWASPVSADEYVRIGFTGIPGVKTIGMSGDLDFMIRNAIAKLEKSSSKKIDIISLTKKWTSCCKLKKSKPFKSLCQNSEARSKVSRIILHQRGIKIQAIDGEEIKGEGKICSSSDGLGESHGSFIMPSKNLVNLSKTSTGSLEIFFCRSPKGIIFKFSMSTIGFVTIGIPVGEEEAGGKGE